MMQPFPPIEGVLPSLDATRSIGSLMFLLASPTVSKMAESLGATAAATLPAQVRKFFAVTSRPVISRS
jgi:hypothetical protein